MIEKIMKAVKSGNKKRGRNITVGAVVGMLLSCTVAMGTDVSGLEITKESDTIIFKDKDGTKFEPGTENDPYLENTWDKESKTYTNNTILSGTSNDDSSNGCGIILNGNLGEFKFINNALITGTSTKGYGIGIYNQSGTTITELVNDGSITGTSTESYGSGISNEGTIKTLTNNGTIKGTSAKSSNYIISNEYGTIETLTNNGTIKGTVTEGSSFGVGIYNDFGTITTLTNKGYIKGTDTEGVSYGISNYYGTIKTLTNTGVVYGGTNAIDKEDGTISNADNYGLLVSGDSTENVTTGVTIVAYDVTGGENEIKNYGLAFIADSSSGKYIGGGKSSTSDPNPSIDYYNSFGEIHQNVSIDGVDYDIINVDAEVDATSKEIKNWKSLTLEEGKLTYYDSNGASDKEESISPDKKYILNGIEDTLKVSGENNELNNSVVNAYKTAVVINENMSTLTLDNTVVNGGIAEDSTAISITEDGSTLTLKGDSIINSTDTAIMITGNNNAVTLEGNAIVNGKMESKGNNILNLYGKADGSMNMFHDISGFTDISIDNNVTFFEDMKVTGTDKVTVEKSGVLNLRLTKEKATVTAAIASSTPISIATHAFSGTDGMLIKGNSPEESGTLNFITNGIGKKILVDMENIELNNIKVKTNSIIDKVDLDTYKDEGYIYLGAGSDLDGIVNPKVNKYNSLNKIYKSIYNSTDEKNLDGLRDILGMTFLGKNYDYNSSSDQLKILLSYLNDIYTGTPYSYSSELSRRSVGMFRDIVVDNIFRPETNKWMIMGGLTHADGGTKDTYYGQNYHGVDIGTADTEADMKLTGAYMLAKYGYSENLSLGVTLGGNKSEAEMSMSKVKGNSGYLGAFAENYRGNLTLKAGAGVQYSEYDADRRTLGNAYSDKYSDMTYDIYLNGRYSHQVGANLFLEPYATLSYTYVDQDGANEGSKALAIETDSKSFDYTVGKMGVDLKKVIPHEKGKSTLSVGVSYTKILDGADEEYITGRFKGSTTDFDILVAHKNEHSIGLNAKYALELESGVIFDVKGSYSVERDSHNGSAKNKTKGEWIVGAGVGYKF
ncbi:autotransporter family protein [Fusobacterium ulcerans]|uniref:autotransporter family protein n=1 Tax=Fusobacterium ulcerans TaxID=861 RepID=UPI001D0BCEB1|nr:autotransporter outer membrane beta-barrel domain-containing protein [Fusobacterium ulcerans]MCB8565103.1 autotransporter outer membrane beta-barrel domain-containing protein [Fusobacterium ulcerans]MCB8649016.1 autotransporter outer membrane beta-barrel domain-containing protein [Fusobacterium ulcerans]